ncbi:MAG: OmpH family outer membrane protein [Pseudodesulfovibrio sp.]|nr:OmpH family outer membrane protein [Pseudodesulfovibrio sp.]
MKKILMLAICFVLLLQVSAFAEVKVGVFNMQKVMLESDYGKAVAAKLKSKFEPLELELAKEGESIKALENELKKQDLALKLDAKQDKQREYRRKTRDFQDSVVAYRQKRQTEQQQLGQPIAQKVAQVVSKYSTDNGFTIVFEAQSSGVAFIAAGVDMSDALILELNKMKKAGK